MIFAQCQQSNEVVSDNERQIVFVSNRGNFYGGFQVYIMDSEGGNIRRLTHDSSNYFYPRFSPDGLQILFYSENGADDDIFLIDVNGENLANLTNSPGNDALPQFSPDGSKIVFTSDRDGNREIYLMDRDGSHQTRLTNNSFTDDSPQFSPDGKKIVFYSSIDNLYTPDSYDIYQIDPDGTRLTKLTPDSTFFHLGGAERSPTVINATPRFSPDGSRIVFQTYQQNDFVINMMNTDGSNHVRLAYQAGGNFDPYFYPDGSQVLFRSHRNGYFELYRMAPYEGAAQIKLISGVAHPFFAEFSEAGSKILYFSNLGETSYEFYHIYVANYDGSQSRKLTHGDFADYFPDFQPRH